MTSGIHTTSTQCILTVVPDQLPADDALPRGRVASFWHGFFMHWLVPCRYGPGLIGSNFMQALKAYALTVVVALCMTTVVILHGLGVSRLEDVRAGLASLLFRSAENGPLALVAVVLVVGLWGVPWCGVLGLFGAFWVAGQDSAFSIIRRSVRNALWGTVVLWPMAIAIGGLALAGWDIEKEQFVMGTAALAATSYLWVVFLTAAGHARVHAATGTARAPTCEGCGYPLVGLPVHSNCPECGIAITESMPGGRRSVAAWDLRPLNVAARLVKLQFVVLSDRHFARRIPVRRHLNVAQVFWWHTFLLMAIVLIVGLQGLRWLIVPYWNPREVDLAVLSGILGLVVLQTLGMFLACIWARLRHGMRDYRVASAASCYASPLLWPIVGYAVILTYFGDFSVDRATTFALLDLQVPLRELVRGGLGLAGIGLFAFWWLRICAALRDVRYANA